MAIKSFTGIVALGVLLLVGSVRAQMMASPDAGPKGTDAAAKDVVLDAAAQEIGRALFLRCLCGGENLSFDAHGHLDEGSKAKTVDWTLAGVNVQKVFRKSPETVELDGVRVGVRWNDDAHEFQRRDIKEQPVRIVVASDADRASAERSLQAVFSVGIDRAFQMSMPPYWQHYFFPTMAWPKDALDGVSIAQVGGKNGGVDVPSPVQTKHVRADYTLEATAVRLQGPVVMQIVVDAQGAPRRIRIVQPLGYGLDAVAVGAAEKSLYEPPMVGGKPAAVSFYGRANFSIHEIPSF